MTLKKWFVFAVAVCMFVPMLANATITRVIGLGGSSANPIVHDHANAGIWPQLVKNYDRQAGADFNTDYGPWQFGSAYINWDFGGEESCVLQMSLDRSNNRRFGWGDQTQNPLGGLDNQAGGYSRLNASIGHRLTSMLIGGSLHWAGKGNSTDNSNGGTETDNSYSEIGLTFGLSAMEEKLDASIGFVMGSWSLESGGTVGAEADGAMDIMINARWWMTQSDQYALIPNIAINMHNDGSTYNGGASASANGTMIRLGVGNNWTPADNMLALAEVGLQMNSTKWESSNGSTTVEGTNGTADIYWRLGFETEVFSWLDGRFGAERAWRGQSQEFMNGAPAPGSPSWSSSITSTYLGATAHWNRLWIDTIVNPSFMGWGPNFVSGYNDMMFWRSSITYAFGEGE